MNQDERDLELGRRVREWMGPKDVNWVEARFACSVEKTWETLRAKLRSDYVEWKRLAPPLVRDYCTLSGDEQQVVIAYSNGPWLRVARKNEAIRWTGASHRQVDQSSVEKRELTPVLSAWGECRLKLDGEELEIWQASRRILEPVLFGS